MILPTEDKKLRKQIHTLAKTICLHNVGIGCVFNYDCEGKPCCLKETDDILKAVEKLGYHAIRLPRKAHPQV